jgi:DNA ligase-1
MNKTFYGKDKGGKYKVWAISTSHVHGGDFGEDGACINISHGSEGGVMTLKTDYVNKGKQGRTPYEQAVSEAEGRIKKQVDKGYRENKADLEELPLLAMLSGDYNKIGHRIDWESGVHVPDKFDGLRCLVKCAMGGGITLESRTGQPYDVPHIVAELEKIMQPGDVLDAEIYLHGYVLQDINSAVKRTDTQKKIDQAQKKLDKHDITPNGTDGDWYLKWEELRGELEEAKLIHEIRPKLQLYVFDMPSDKPWYVRLIELQDYAAARFCYGFVKLAKNPLVFSEAGMKVLHKDAVRRGFEGVMLRNRMGMYESGKRSADLQKYKEFVDEEFEVLDILPAKDDGSVYLLKNNLNDLTFTCTMGDMAYRAFILDHKELVVHKFLNVKFQSRYKGTLLPQFPTGEYIREGKMVNGEFVPNE